MSAPSTDSKVSKPPYPVTFRSAVGIFYYVVLVFLVVITIVAFKPAFEEQPVNTLLLPLFFTLLLCWGLPAWMLLATDYTVTEQLLKIRCGPFRWAIERADIQDIRPTRNPVSGPALSLDRLEVLYKGYKRILVSPEDRTGFFRALGMTPRP